MVTVRVAVFVAFAVLMASPARADRITAGSLIYSGSGVPIDVTLHADGFRFDGRASHFSGIFMPWMQCVVPECLPGVTVDLWAHFSGMDLPGTATVGTQTYLNVGSLASTSGALGTWRGSLPIPLGFQSGALTAPFTFTGLFSFEERPGAPRVLNLFGGGTATAVFTPSGLSEFPGALALQSIRYDFEPEAAPTPEPASMFLLVTGLAGVAAARRLRRSGLDRSNDPHS